MTRISQYAVSVNSAEAAFAIAIPHARKSFRFASAFATTASALARPYRIEPDRWFEVQSATGPSLPALEDGAYFAAICRNPLASKVKFDQNTAGLAWHGEVQFAHQPAPQAYPNPVPPGITTEHIILVNRDPFVSPPIDLPMCRVEDIGATTDWHPFGSYLYTPTHKARRGVWMNQGNEAPLNGGTQIFVTVALATGTITVARSVTLTVYRLDGSEWIPVDTIDGTTTTGPTAAVTLMYGCLVSGYHAFSITYGVDATGSAGFWKVSALMDHVGSGYVINSIPHIEDRQEAVQAIRPLAASIMVSPNTAKFQRQGRIRAVQLPVDQQWYSLKGRQPFDELATAAELYDGPLEEGYYGFLKPVDVQDFAEKSPFIIRKQGDSTILIDVDFPVFPPGGWLVVTARADGQSLGGGPTNYPAGATYTTTVFGVEFTTLDTWYEQNLPQLSTREMQDAFELLKQVPQHHCNPFHISDITKAVMGAAKGGLAVAPGLLNAFSALAPPKVAAGMRSAAEIGNLVNGLL
jgi:hypothetical protein